MGLGTDDSGPVEIIPPDGKEFKVLTYRYANGAVMIRDPEKLKAETGQDNGVMFEGTEGKVAVWRYTLRTWPENLIKQKIGPIRYICTKARTIIPISSTLYALAPSPPAMSPLDAAL